MYTFDIWNVWVPWWYPKKSIIQKIAVMKHENHIWEEDSMALSTVWVPWRYPKIFWKESVRSELSNAEFEKFVSLLKRKWERFQILRFLMHFIQNCDILAVHYRKAQSNLESQHFILESIHVSKCQNDVRHVIRKLRSSTLCSENENVQ